MSVRPRTRSARVGRRRLRLRDAVGIACAIAAVAFSLGRLSGGGTPDGGVASRTASETGSSHSRVPAIGAEEGGAHRTRDGAGIAAARALMTLADPLLLVDTRRRRAVVARIATPGYRRELEPAIGATYEHLRSELGTDPSRIAMRMHALGYRVEAYDGRRASVAVWQVTILGSIDRAPVAAWATSRAELRWSEGRWLVARFGADTPGPTPAVTAPANASPPVEFVSSTRGFTRLVL